MSIDNGIYNVTQAYNLGHLKIANHGFIEIKSLSFDFEAIVLFELKVEVNEKELQKYQGLDDQVNEMESLYRDANQKSIKIQVK